MDTDDPATLLGGVHLMQSTDTSPRHIPRRPARSTEESWDTSACCSAIERWSRTKRSKVQMATKGVTPEFAHWALTSPLEPCPHSVFCANAKTPLVLVRAGVGSCCPGAGGVGAAVHLP